MTGSPRPNTIWLASYPKSGNTWFRAIVSALKRGEELFTIEVLSSGGQPYGLTSSVDMMGMDPRWLTRMEVERLRQTLISTSTGTQPRFRKTHERYRTEPVDWPPDDPPPPTPFPAQSTRASVCIVRDPRAVAVSFAHHFGVTLEKAVDRMAREDAQRADPARLVGEQPWGSWSTHTRSWEPSALPFPAFRVRYEDMLTNPVPTLLPVLRGVGLDVDEDALLVALERVRLDRLQADEDARGFRETHARADRFFRTGRADAWLTDLPEHLIRTIEADHCEVMQELGYELTTDAAARAATYRARASARRHRANRWDRLPDHLGIEVEESAVPDHLDGGRVVSSWIEVAPDRALVRLVGGTRVLVSNGTHARVHIDPDMRDTGDWAWPVQGWAVTLAMLQRGLLVLHAASVERDGVAWCIAGPSSAGKSTTAVGLAQRGHGLLVDDVTALTHGSAGPRVLPYLRGVHLTATAAANLGLDYENLPHLSAGRGKGVFLGDDPGTAEPALGGIVVLRRSRTVHQVTVQEVSGSERLALLRRQSEREGAAPAILGDRRYFELLAAVAAATPVFVITRPIGTWSLGSVLDAVDEAAGMARPDPTGVPQQGVG